MKNSKSVFDCVYCKQKDIDKPAFVIPALELYHGLHGIVNAFYLLYFG
jgi:hypothetical protein